VAATHAKLSLADARTQLREAGLRCTPARIRVLQQLAAAQKPVSHADVADVLAPEGFDKSTVFRCLVQLSEAELVATLDLGDQVRRFEWRAPEDRPGHAHFMCVDCGTVECLDDYVVEVSNRKSRRPLTGHDITEALFKGHCRNCK
jgi:Fur family ferric uptake transcriptional regulator